MRRTLACLVTAALAATILTVAPIAATADTKTTNFEAYTLGSPDGQDGWAFTGPYDVAIADPNTFGVTGMGDRALRISNASTSGSFGDWAFSTSLEDEAGETSAAGGGLSGGDRQPHFEASFDITSAVPDADQAGLQFSLAPDRGDGARMSFLRFNDTAGGIDVTSSDYIDAHAQGPGVGACSGSDDFVTRTIAEDLARDETHTVTISMDFLDGRANDRVEIWIDGALAGVGTSWEDYFRDCEGNPTRTVDSLIFQARGNNPAPATLGEGFLIDNLELRSGPIQPSHTTGSWTSDTFTQVEVRQPINAAGGSNFPKHRGVIPVQFALFTKVDDGVLESILDDDDPANDFGFLGFSPDTPIPFNALDSLMADYEFTLGDCHGGALRWSVRVDTDGDGGGDGSVFIYYGDAPNFTECTATNDGSGVEMIGASDVRYDLTQFGGPFYGTYAQALGLVGTGHVTRASLVLDAGWGGNQRVVVTRASVNDAVYTPASLTTSEFIRTCDLPPARIEVEKVDGSGQGVLNEELESVSEADSGNDFRIVDCKYLYNLDVRTLGEFQNRDGTYEVWVKIGGNRVASPGRFDLK